MTAALRLAVAGKGGAGKSLIAGTLARVLARRGHRVLALDSDLQPGLSYSLGVRPTRDEPPLAAAAERDENGRWRLRPGIGAARAVARYASDAPDGVRLLQAGKATLEGVGPIMPALQAFYRVIHRLDEPASLRAWTLIGDLPAGPRQVAFDWAPYADRFLLVVEPTWQSMLTARRITRIVSARADASLALVVSKVGRHEDRARVERYLGLQALAAVPMDEAVAEAERRGAAPLDAAPGAPAVQAIERLADALDPDTVSEA